VSRRFVRWQRQQAQLLPKTRNEVCSTHRDDLGWKLKRGDRRVLNIKRSNHGVFDRRIAARATKKRGVRFVTD
jgi:hypothetical protein